MANGYLSGSNPTAFWSAPTTPDSDHAKDMAYLDSIGYYERKRFYTLGINERNEILRKNRQRVAFDELMDIDLSE